MFSHLIKDTTVLNAFILLIPGWKYIISSLELTNASLKMKEALTFFFISLGPFAIAKLTKNVITRRSRGIIAIPLEVNLRKEEARYSPLLQSHTEVILGLQWKQRRLHSASNWYASRLTRRKKKTMHINKANFKMSSYLFLAHTASDCDYFHNQYSLNWIVSSLTQHKH